MKQTALLLSLLVSPVLAGNLGTENDFELPEGAVERRHVQVRMRDGARLDTHVFLPSDDDVRFPTVLVRSPYRFELDYPELFYQRLLGEGYAVVFQHERGRFLSEGDFTMLIGAEKDGWDTLDWIVAQAWSDGKVGTYGCSSSGENQLKLGAAGHPAHKAMIAMSAGVGVAEAGPFREQGNFWRGGVWQQGWFDYFFEHMQIHWPQLPAGLSDDERQRTARAFVLVNAAQEREAAEYDELRMHLPMIEMAHAGGAPTTDFETYLRRGPSHPAWKELRVTEDDQIDVPTLWGEALYDISARSTVAFFEHTRRLNEARGERDQFMIVTNGTHCGFGEETRRSKIGDRRIGDARFDYLSLFIDWFDHWLKGVDNQVTDRAAIRTYLAGADEWQEFDEVPRAGDRALTADGVLTLYLASQGRANTLEGDGRLLTAPPEAGREDTFLYDPENPVIAHGGEISGVGEDQHDGAFDQREIESREDVLVYSTPPLAQDVAVFGFIEAILYVASDRPDTDFTVKLVDVYPNGRAYNISDSILRMRYREGIDREVFMEQGQVYEIRLPPMLAANVFKRRHRIRVEVSSSHFPSYARNLNTRENPYTSNEHAVASNRVLHGPDTPSRIELPGVSPATE